MVNSNKQAITEARKTTKNTPGFCQGQTRDWFNAPSAGDRDGDGDADANDGWLSEPVSARVFGDRNPPEGAPLYFKNKVGGGFGHRCISEVGNDQARSTDMFNGRYSKGNTSKCTITQLEASMGLIYVGWSRTITGIPIPGLEKKAPPKPKLPAWVQPRIERLRERRARINARLKRLRGIKPR